MCIRDSNETGQISWDKGTPVPTLLLPTPQQEQYLAGLKDSVEQGAQQLKIISQAEKEAIASWIDKESYRKLSDQHPLPGLVAHFPLENDRLTNVAHPGQRAKMGREY